MYEVFQNYIDSKISPTKEQSDWIRSLSTVKKLRKNQYLLQAGHICRDHAFVSKGVLRSYSIGENDVEHIVKFAPENWWIADRDSLMSGEPATLNIDALEDSEVVLLSKQNFDLIREQVPAFNDMVRALFQKAYEASQIRVLASISLSASQKYEHFLQRYPDLILRLPQSMIASYLGISRETLSRARSHKTAK